MLRIEGKEPAPLVPRLNLYALHSMVCAGELDGYAAEEDELMFTNRETLRDVNTLARALHGLGVRRGEVVMVATGRSLHETTVILMALNRLGASVCIQDEYTTKTSLVQFAEIAEARVMFVYHWQKRKMAEMARRMKGVEFIINITAVHDRRTFETSILETFDICGITIPEIAGEVTGPVPIFLFNVEDAAVISFTSGSKSGPKPLLITNENIVAVAIYTQHVSKIPLWSKKYNAWMSYVHFDCPYGLIVSVICPRCDGGKIIYTPEMCRERLDYYVAKGADVIFGIPPLLEDMRKYLSPDVSMARLKIFATGGDRLEEEENEAAEQWLKARGSEAIIMNCYGTGETLGFITTAFGTTEYRPNTVGYIPPGVDVLMLDPDDPTMQKEVGFGEPGILCAAGKHVIEHFFKRPDLDEQKFIERDGRRFLITGDLAIVSPDGYVELIGRATFFINNVPAKVYCEIVETAVERSQYVKHCYVVKAPDEEFGYVTHVYAVLHDKVNVSEEKVRLAALATATEPFRLGKGMVVLKEYELPRQIFFLRKLPTTKSNKVNFRLLEKWSAKIAEGQMTETEQKELFGEYASKAA